MDRHPLFSSRAFQGCQPASSDATMANVMGRFRPIVRQHLADEEDIVIPLILERARKGPEFG
jgi:hypothetical protein